MFKLFLKPKSKAALYIIKKIKIAVITKSKGD